MVLDTSRILALAAGALIVYAGAARMLWPLRGELDVPARMTVLLRPRPGRVLLAHATVPAATTVAAAVLGVAGCAVAGVAARAAAVPSRSPRWPRRCRSPCARRCRPGAAGACPRRS